MWRGRRGQSQPQREWPPRPPVPPTPEVPTTARCTHPLAKSYGRAVARRRFDPGGVRCVLSASSHGSSPPFVWRAAEKPRSACAQDGAHRLRKEIAWRSCIGRSACRAAYTEARSAGPRRRSCPPAVPSRGPSGPTRFGVSDRRPLREDAWRSRGSRSVQRNAMLSYRRSIGERSNGSLRCSWSMAHVLGVGHARGLQSWR